MKIKFHLGEPLRVAADALLVPTFSDDLESPDGPFATVDRALDGEVARLAQDAKFSGQVAKTLTFPSLGQLQARWVVLVGLGRSTTFHEPVATRVWGAAARAARDTGAANVVSFTPPLSDLTDNVGPLAAAVEGAHLGLYQFTKYLGTGTDDSKKTTSLETLEFVDDQLPTTHAAAALQRGEAIAAAVALARDLVNEPASVLTPASMAERARQVATENGLEIDVVDSDELERMGANVIAAVGRGSSHKPCLIRLRYRPSEERLNAESARTVGIIGKCITFDTGGYSIKTTDGMLEMKTDMAGGAAVLGAMSALRPLACPVAVNATICAAENMISGDAFRPGDVLTALNGVTIEVLSTDAEGRLVLADGLVDAARQGATELIDLATLTGAAVVALGDGTSALFASHDDLAARLLDASARAGERAWRLPLTEEFNEKISGTIADIKNSGGRQGAAIIAALFLQRFTEGLPWAHFDIAGTARRTKAGALGPRGASGVGVRTLLAYLVPPEQGARIDDD